VKALAASLGAAVLLLGGGALVMNVLVPNPVIDQQRAERPADRDAAPAYVPNSWHERWGQNWKGELICGVALTPDGQTLAIGKADGSVLLLETSAGKEIGRLGAAPPPAAGFPGLGGFGGMGGGLLAPLGSPPVLTCLAFSPDGKSLATGNGNGQVEVWDVATRRSRARLSPGEGSHIVQAVTFAPDGKSILAGGAAQGQLETTGWLQHWDIATSKGLCRHAAEPSSAVSSLSFHPDGRSVAFVETISGKDGSLQTIARFLDLGTGKVTWQTPPEADAPLAFLHDPGAKALALACTDGTIKVWDPVRKAFQGRLKGMNRLDQGSSAAMSADGRHFATLHWTPGATGQAARGPEVWFWDGPTGKLVRWVTFPTQFAPAWLAFSADGSILAVGGTGVDTSNAASDPPAIGGFGPARFGGMVGEVKLLSLERDASPVGHAPAADPDSSR
jgi:WD40 repeat protein